MLLAKTNRFEVEVHQSAAGINDFTVYFGMELDYTTNFTVLRTNTSPVPPMVHSVLTGPNTEVISWNTTQGGLNWALESNTDVKTTGWTPVPNSSTSPFTVTVPATGRKFYRARRM